MFSKKLFKTLFIFHFFLSITAGFCFGYILSEVEKSQQISLLVKYKPTVPTRLYDSNGIVFAELYKHKQNLIKYRDLPPHLIQAFLSIEDNNFFEHFGVDLKGIVRATVINLMAGRIKQGGSTITQQLAKIILENRKKTFTRKFYELLFSLQIEEKYSKEEILEIYFNLIYLGHGAKGVQVASDLYFRKPVYHLNISESALLARLPKAPVKYSPYKNPEIAKNIHLLVLNSIANNGYIDKEQINNIHSSFWLDYWPIVITTSASRSAWGSRLNEAPHFTQYVVQKLEKVFGDALYTGGYKIYTTLDIKKQKIVQQALRKSIQKHDTVYQGLTAKYGSKVDKSLVSIYETFARIFPLNSLLIKERTEESQFRKDFENNLIDELEILSAISSTQEIFSMVTDFRKSTRVYNKNLHVEGAAVTVEQSTGHIKTMVGGYEFTPRNQFNRATQAYRQTGSSFKPFIYGAGIDSRVIASNSGILDAPITTLSEQGDSWSPKDFSGNFRGMVPISKALSLSLNLVSVKIMLKTGIEKIIDFSSNVTQIARSRFPKVPALALGVAELSPLEMARAYAIIENDGKNVIPFAIRYVIDQDGNYIYNQEKEIQGRIGNQIRDGSIQVINKSTAYILKNMLIQVAQKGTPTKSLREQEYFGVSGGKTGSTSSYSDAWYCGFDPKYTTVIWFGFDKGLVSLGRGQVASLLTVPVWGNIYKNFYKDGDYPKFKEKEKPKDVFVRYVCSFNGKMPKKGVCSVIPSYGLFGKNINNKWHSVPINDFCRGEQDHYRSLNFEDFLKNLDDSENEV